MSSIDLEADELGSHQDRRCLTRRALLGGVAAGAASITAGQAAAGQTEPAARRKKGPPVFLDYDQAALDAAYDQSVWAPNAQQILRRYASNSEAMRIRLGAPQRFSYGSTPVECLDLYLARRPKAPINIFIHGGAWRSGRATDYGFLAELFLQAGACFVVPDFVAVQEAGGSLTMMAQQVRGAIAWIYRNASTFGGDPERLYVSGHSSGAHLAGVVLTTDWAAAFGLPPEVLKGGLCCSGMFDLRGPRLSARSSYVKLDDATEEALSPQRLLDKVRCPVIVAYGSLESPEFQRQSRDFAAALERASKPVQLLYGDGYNHFEMLETLANPYGLLGRAQLEQMKLVSG